MIYLIQSNNLYKIGYTSNIEQRMNAYKAMNPNTIILNYKEGSTKDEVELHHLCYEYRTEQKEWFNSDKVIEIFNNYKSKYKEVIKSKDSQYNLDYIAIDNNLLPETEISKLNILETLIVCKIYINIKEKENYAVKSNIVYKITIGSNLFDKIIKSLIEKDIIIKFKVSNYTCYQFKDVNIIKYLKLNKEFIQNILSLDFKDQIKGFCLAVFRYLNNGVFYGQSYKLAELLNLKQSELKQILNICSQLGIVKATLNLSEYNNRIEFNLDYKYLKSKDKLKTYINNLENKIGYLEYMLKTLSKELSKYEESNILDEVNDYFKTGAYGI